MFRLTNGELTNAYDAICHHGYSALIPTPTEWRVVGQNWDAIRNGLQSVDLEQYRPHTPLRVYAPKSRYNLRVVTLLHPLDLIIYTALVLIAKDEIEAARIPSAIRSVFAFRANPNRPNRLYDPEGSYDSYREELRARSTRTTGRVVATADIADFYSRIYHHRLENALASLATSQRVRNATRILVRRFLGGLSNGNSYGIPVGPLASRLLGEALLIDVDEALLGERYRCGAMGRRFQYLLQKRSGSPKGTLLSGRMALRQARPYAAARKDLDVPRESLSVPSASRPAKAVEPKNLTE